MRSLRNDQLFSRLTHYLDFENADKTSNQSSARIESFASGRRATIECAPNSRCEHCWSCSRCASRSPRSPSSSNGKYNFQRKKRRRPKTLPGLVTQYSVERLHPLLRRAPSLSERRLRQLDRRPAISKHRNPEIEVTGVSHRVRDFLDPGLGSAPISLQ